MRWNSSIGEKSFCAGFSGEISITGISKVRQDQTRKIKETADTEGESGLFRLYNRMHVMPVDRLKLAIASGLVVERLWDRTLISPGAPER